MHLNHNNNILEDIDAESIISGLVLLTGKFFIGFTPDTLFALFILILLLICSALVSGSETAFFSLSPADLESLKQRGGKSDKAIINLLSVPKKLLATILISNNFINVSIVMISTYITAGIFNLQANAILVFVVQVVIVTSILLIFGEIIPKILANKEPVAVAHLMVRTLQGLVWFFKPLSHLLVSSTSVIDKKISKRGHNISMSDLSDALEITSDNTVTEDEKSILKGIATFGEKEASEIMISRVDVTAIDTQMKFSEVNDIVISSGFSRIPVYEDTLDNIVGILYIKDLLSIPNSSSNAYWQKLIRKPVFFVPENKHINDLLQDFRQKKMHLAIVVDEYGGTSGIITLEDIIEEIVGEISDEFDVDSHQFKFSKLDDGIYIFEAKTPIVDFCKIMEVDDDVFEEVRGESDSLGGLILEIEKKIPEPGSVINFSNFRFEITKADERRIIELKVKIDEEK